MLSISTDSLVLIVTLFSLTLGVNSEIASWFTGHHHPSQPAQELTKDNNGTLRPLHEILNITKPEMKVRDVSGAEAAAAASALPPQILQGGAFPPGAYPTMGYPGFGFPGFGGGAGLNLGLDAGLGGGFLGGVAPYFPIIEKVIVIVGGGILILIFLALLQAFMVKNKFLGDFFDLDFAKSFAGAVDVDAGPFHASKSASGSMAFDQNGDLTHRVMNGVNTRW